MTLRQILWWTSLAVLAQCPIQAATNHTWVAGYGNDGNPCSVTQPCATFTVALSNTNAGGVISVLSPGDFGPLTINQAVTIDGGAVGGTITSSSGGALIRVQAGPSDTVILRHLSVNGLSSNIIDGIDLMEAGVVMIEDCDIEGITNFGLAVETLTVPINVTIKNTRIVGGSIGVRIFQTTNHTPLDIISMRNVLISGASAAGVFTRNGTMDISDSLITQSAIGVEADTEAFLNVSNSVISFNATDEEFFPDGSGIGGIFLSNNNTLFGNNGYSGPPGGTQPLSVAAGTVHRHEQAPPDPRDRRPH